MTIWLGKIDPEHLSIDDIQKSGTALWKVKGEKMLVYHSNEKEIVGVVEILDNNPDPDHPLGRLVHVKFIKKFDVPHITLAQVKESGKFDDFRLVKEPRLSVMDVPDEFLKYFNISI